MPIYSKIAEKGKGVRKERPDRGLDPQVEGSNRQHRSPDLSNIALPESSSTSTQLVAFLKQEYAVFCEAHGFSSATLAEIAFINKACEGREGPLAAFIRVLLEGIQKDPRVEEHDWYNAVAWWMRHVPPIISPGQPHDQLNMDPSGLDEVKIVSKGLNFILGLRECNPEGLNMKGKCRMIDSEPEQGLSRVKTLPDFDDETHAGPSNPIEYHESDEDEEVTIPGMKGTRYGPAGVPVTGVISEEETPSIMGSTQHHASAAPDLSLEEVPVGTNNPQQTAGTILNGLWGLIFFLWTLWMALE